MQSQPHPWDDGVPRGLSVDDSSPEVPGARPVAGMPPSAWTQEIGADVGGAAGAGGEPPSVLAGALVAPLPTVPGDAARALLAPATDVVGPPVRSSDATMSRASNEQLLQAAVRATREAAQAAAEQRRSLEQHKRRSAS